MCAGCAARSGSPEAPVVQVVGVGSNIRVEPVVGVARIPWLYRRRPGDFGDWAPRGTLRGRTGRTGRTTRPHLTSIAAGQQPPSIFAGGNPRAAGGYRVYDRGMSTPCPNCGVVRPTPAEQRYHNARCGNVGYSIIGDSLGAGVFTTVCMSTVVLWYMTAWPIWVSFLAVCGLLTAMVAVMAWQDRHLG